MTAVLCTALAEDGVERSHGAKHRPEHETGFRVAGYDDCIFMYLAGGGRC